MQIQTSVKRKRERIACLNALLPFMFLLMCEMLMRHVFSLSVAKYDLAISTVRQSDSVKRISRHICICFFFPRYVMSQFLVTLH